MKLTKEQKKRIKDAGRDNEEIHIIYDSLMEDRLLELDPEFVKDLDKATEGTTFWYA